MVAGGSRMSAYLNAGMIDPYVMARAAETTAPLQPLHPLHHLTALYAPLRTLMHPYAPLRALTHPYAPLRTLPPPQPPPHPLQQFFPHGQCSGVHFGGHCQTGGTGNIMAAFGLMCDRIQSIKIVLADQNIDESGGSVARTVTSCCLLFADDC